MEKKKGGMYINCLNMPGRMHNVESSEQLYSIHVVCSMLLRFNCRDLAQDEKKLIALPHSCGLLFKMAVRDASAPSLEVSS